ncbi:MAG: hypothetical protein HY942_03890 [Gammaproteobacteria bacterium]|nr:hypothetical protein [Gammaproteobacteria bacterium]
MALVTAQAVAAESAPVTPPIDPFDYSYCGGKPVYPVVGYNFGTACGPRNQLALGRRGSLMWSFPSPDNKTPLHRGKRLLGTEELKRLSLLAEVAQLADPTIVLGGPVIYDLGIDFQGRAYKRLHTTFTDGYTPANELLRAMLALVPDPPTLPACTEAAPDFNPSVVPSERRSDKHTAAKTDAYADR